MDHDPHGHQRAPPAGGPTENASDLGYKAALKALDEAGMKAGELTHVIAATCTPDSLCPSVACIISGKLGAGAVMAFDVSAACSGFLYGLSLCRSILAQDPAARILFVCAEALTRRSDWTDRTTCVLFGDGAGACILTADDRPPLATLEDAICKSDGSLNQLIIVGGGTASQYKQGDPVGSDFLHPHAGAGSLPPRRPSDVLHLRGDPRT